MGQKTVPDVTIGTTFLYAFLICFNLTPGIYEAIYVKGDILQCALIFKFSI